MGLVLFFCILILVTFGGVAFFISKRIKKELVAKDNTYAMAISIICFLVIFAALVLGAFYIFLNNVQFVR